MLDHLRPLFSQSVKRKYTPDSTILFQGEAPRTAYILASGVVKVFNISAQGDEQIVAYHIAGEFFPTAWIFNKTPGALYFYEATTECEVYAIERAKLLSHMDTDETKRQALLDYFATTYTASLIRISALEQTKAREKLLYTLYFLCERYGKKTSVHTVISLSLTHQHLASLVGLTRETTATIMSSLKKQKIISYDSQSYTVDQQKLMDIIGEDSFRNIEITA